MFKLSGPLRMADTSISTLPYYEQWAPEAVSPTGRQMTVLGWAHITKEILIVNWGCQAYLLSRQRFREEPGYFNVLGELRELELGPDEIFRLILEATEQSLMEVLRQWQEMEVAAEIVYHVALRTLNLRYRSEWKALADDLRDDQEQRARVLKGVPSPFASWCLGAPALGRLHTLSTVLRTFSKTCGREKHPREAVDLLQDHLAGMGLKVSLTGAAEWFSSEPDPGFARAEAAPPEASWAAVDCGVVCCGLQATRRKYEGAMCYLGVSRLGALLNSAVCNITQGP